MSDSYADLGDLAYPPWTSSMADTAPDPIEALERFRATCEKPLPAAFARPLYLLRHEEYAKAARGEPFYYLGVLCTLEGGHPVPI